MRTMVMYFKIIVTILILANCSKKPLIDFYQERVVIEIDSLGAFVTGEYFFNNLSRMKKLVRFFYPFPVDECHQYPDIIAFDSPYTKDTNGIYFVKLLSPGKDNRFKISYRQRLGKRYFRYITTTTRMWQRPMACAEFIIYAPKSYQLRINYKLDRIVSDDKRQSCYIKIYKFYPSEDLIIEW